MGATASRDPISQPNETQLSILKTNKVKSQV